MGEELARAARGRESIDDQPGRRKLRELIDEEMASERKAGGNAAKLNNPGSSRLTRDQRGSPTPGSNAVEVESCSTAGSRRDSAERRSGTRVGGSGIGAQLKSPPVLRQSLGYGSSKTCHISEKNLQAANPSNRSKANLQLKLQETRRPQEQQQYVEMQQELDKNELLTRKRRGTELGLLSPQDLMIPQNNVVECSSSEIASLKEVEDLKKRIVDLEEQSAAALGAKAQSLAGLQETLKGKDREIASLTEKLQHLETKIMMSGDPPQKQQHSAAAATATAADSGSYKDDDTAPSPKILQSATRGAKEAANSFTKTFIRTMTQIQDPQNRKTLEDRIRKESGDLSLSSKSHWKFLVQAFICRRLYAGFENESFNIDSCMSTNSWDVEQYSQDSFKQFQLYRRNNNTVSILVNNQSHDNYLRQFCFHKFQTVVDEQTELLLFSNTHHSAKIHRHRLHPTTEFYRSFCKLAVSVWLLQRLAFSFNNPARIFRACPGQAFDSSFMTSVVPWNSEDEENDTHAAAAAAAADSSGTTSAVVGIMLLPGFRVSKSIIKTEVYLVQSDKIHSSK